MILRPAFHFVAALDEESSIRRRQLREKFDEVKMRGLPFFESLLDGSYDYLSFLLLPIPHSLDYALFIRPGRGGTVSRMTIDMWVKGWLEKKQIAVGWHRFDRVKKGIFYAEGAPCLREKTYGVLKPGFLPIFMEVLNHERLHYLSGNATVEALGPVRQVEKIETALEMGDPTYERLDDVVRSITDGDLDVDLSRPIKRAETASHVAPIRPIRLTWEVLPMGWWKSINLPGPRGQGENRRHLNTERIERLSFLESLGPKSWYEGSHLGERIYFVAVFNRVAVADCPTWGNALYYCAAGGERWRDIFRLTKAGALEAGARRLIHNRYWEWRLLSLVQSGAV